MCSSDLTIVSAEAIWILMNTQKMLPMKVTKEIADIYVAVSYTHLGVGNARSQ